MTTRNLRNQFREFSNKTEQPLKLYSGALGIYIGGTQYVDVPNRPGFVYVRLRNNISELIQAHNQLVSPVYDLPVLIVRKNSYYEIYSRDSEQYASYWVDNSSYLPKHGSQHQFDPDNGGGGDLVFVHGEQFYPLMGFPSGTYGSNNILIAPYRYYFSSAWHYAGNTGTIDLLQYRPTGSANSRLILVGIDVRTGNSFVKIGNEFDASITGAAAMTAYVPATIDVNYEIPGTVVRLVTGTTKITWANLYDARQYMGILQASTGTFQGSFLQLNDTPDSYIGQAGKVPTVKSNETGLEFVAATTSFLALTDTPDGYVGNANRFVAVKSDETGLQFVDSPGGSGGGGLVVYDDGIYKVTGTSISFDVGLDVVVTGTVAFVSSASSVPAVVKLATVELTNFASHISFTGISQAYETIQFIGRVLAHDNNISSLGVILNGISGTVYSAVRIEANNNAWGFVTSASGTSIPISGRVNYGTSVLFGSMSFDMLIPEYADPGKVKTAYGKAGGSVGTLGNNVGPSFANFAGTIVNSVNPYDNIRDVRFFIFGNSTRFASGSTITMYGIS